MPLLNYTTKVAAIDTVAEISKKLLAYGVREQTVRYDKNRKPIGLAFRIDTAFGEQGFVLPADPAPVLKILERDWSNGSIPARYATREQAEKVAWRIVKDWLEAQLAIVETGMVKLDEVMLPYLQTAEGPLYQVVVSGQLALPNGRG
jgi:hypothetical protein